MSVFVTPAAAGQESGGKRRNVPTPEIQHLDAEVKIINGQPVIIIETEEGYLNVPFALSGDVLVQGNGVVVQTEDGFVVVPLEDFEVAVVDGEVVLVAEVNPKHILWGAGIGAVGGAGLNLIHVGMTDAVFCWRHFGSAIVQGAAGTALAAATGKLTTPR
ncbi:MAG: hypothetical protein AAGT88_06320 [Dethiobacter sp.]